MSKSWPCLPIGTVMGTRILGTTAPQCPTAHSRTPIRMGKVMPVMMMMTTMESQTVMLQGPTIVDLSPTPTRRMLMVRCGGSSEAASRKERSSRPED